MATDLVRWGNAPDGDSARGHGAWEHDEEEWDLPPTDPRPGPIHDGRSEGAARRADRQVSDARGRGDGTFAALRAEDAADLRQSRWDWGDFRTWVWIIGMCLGYLLLSACIYHMPYGRHNQFDQPAPTPTIRVY